MPRSRSSPRSASRPTPPPARRRASPRAAAHLEGTLAGHPASDSTSDALLDAAEFLFAAHPYDAVSLRAVTTRARANLAAVSYHFGSKQALYLAVLLRRLRPLNERRILALDAALRAHAPAPVPLRALITAFLAPVAELVDASGPSPHPFVRFMARFLQDPPPFSEGIAREEFASLGRHFGPHLLAHLPHLTPATLVWRARFIFGAANTTFARAAPFERRLAELGAAADGPTQLAQLTAFIEAGLIAPDPAKP